MKFQELVSFARSTILTPEQRIALFHAMIFQLLSKAGFELCESNMNETIYINKKHNMWFHFYKNGAFVLKGKSSKGKAMQGREDALFKRHYSFGTEATFVSDMSLKIRLLTENIHQNVATIKIATHIVDDDIAGIIDVERVQIDNMKDLKLWFKNLIGKEKSSNYKALRVKKEVRHADPKTEPQVSDLKDAVNEDGED